MRDSATPAPITAPYRDRVPQQLFVHLIWTTVDRLPMLTPSVCQFLGRFLPAEALRHGCETIALGMVLDHVHIVVRIPPRIDLPRLVQGLKGASSRLAATQTVTGLRWAKGYEAKTVSPGALSRVVDYVKHQPEHHASPRVRRVNPPLGAGGDPP